MINGNVSSELILLWFASVHDDARSIQSRLCYYAHKKYKNGNSARRISTQRHIRPSICFDESDKLSSGIFGKLPKIATSNVIYSRMAMGGCIAAKFRMTI